ncbi:hypothetical protein ACH35V_02300 [Actinomadura sp. 1N219]|uniref:hypothetical protein n=1 Tax=Actinomadura sp. 1N219 TaxID=3375152 RepID=UPI003798DBC8
MSIEKRASAFALIAPLSGVLLLYCGLAALGSIQHAWGWKLGEEVRVKVAKSCSYLSGSGTLSDCRGSWTSADGEQHTGSIEGTLGDVRLGQTVTLRAGGGTAYAEPSTWIKTIGLPAPFAGGVGAVSLALAFAIRPGKARWAEARDRPLPDEMTTLAQSRDLGAERTRYWAPSSATRGVVTFEHGFAFSWDGEIDVHRWDEIRGVFERYETVRNKVGRQYVVWTGGDAWLTLTDQQIEDLAGFGKDIVQYVTDHLRPKVLEMLRQGETYLFPKWGSASYTEFTPHGVGGADGLIPYSELAAVDIQNGRIVIRGQGGQRLVRSWGDTANVGMLVVMLRDFIANHRDRNRSS